MIPCIVWRHSITANGAADPSRYSSCRAVRNSDIWSIDSDGPPTRLIASGREDLSAHFSLDGKRIAFASSRSGFLEIWIANADGSQPAHLTNMKASVTGWPVWSPNGTNPEQVLTRVQSFKFVPTNNGIYYIRTEETAQDKVIATLPFTYTQAGLDLSPVGKTLLFAPLEQTDGDLMSVQIQP